MIRIILIMLLLSTVLGCSKSELAIDGKSVKARVMYNSCGGTILQFIDSTGSVGKDWHWYENLSQPFNASNPPHIYTQCVSAFEVPKERQIIGDTLEFTYKQLSGPLGNVCAIGGLPNAYISVINLRSK